MPLAQSEVEMNIELTDDEVNTIMRVLSSAPWNVANPLMMKIGKQMAEQMPAQGGNAGAPLTPFGEEQQRANKLPNKHGH